MFFLMFQTFKEIFCLNFLVFLMFEDCQSGLIEDCQSACVSYVSFFGEVFFQILVFLFA